MACKVGTVIASSNSAPERTWSAGSSVSAQVLRQWIAPEVILAVTDLADEKILLFHCIQQTRRSTAKVVLVHVMQPESLTPHPRAWTQSAELRNQAECALAGLDRMARQLRWAGIPCEPLLLRGSPAKEIPLVAEARNADRILMSAVNEKRAGDTGPKTLAEELLPGISIPICTVAHGLPTTPASSGQTGDITLALSLHTDAEMPLAFASRLAQEEHAKLTVMHVFGREEKGRKEIEQTPLSVALQLPADRLREAELMCPLEIAVRKGDPATEILKFGSGANEDFIVLGPLGRPPSRPAAASSVAHRVIREALCPVLVLGPSVGRSAMG